MFLDVSKIYTSINLFKTAFYKYKKTILVLTGLGFLSGILGGVGIGAVVPLFSFISNQGGATNDHISAIFKGVFAFFGIEFSLPLIVVMLIAVFIFKAIFLYIASLISARATTEYEAETRNELFKHTMRANWPYLIDRKIGHLSQMIAEDVDVSANLLTSIGLIILFLTSLITYAVVAIGISPYITLATILIGIIIFFVLKPLFYKIRVLSNKAALMAKEVSHHVNQHLIGAKTVKSMAVEEKIVDEGGSYFRELAKSKLNRSKYTNVLSTFLEPLTLAVIIPIFLFSYKSPSFNIASFAAILYLVEKMFSFMQSMQIRIGQINQNIPHLVAVVNYQTEARKYRERSDGGDDFRFKSLLKFEDVRFYYGDAKEKILDGLNFTVRKGETVGLIGHSGSGKTTIADLILRLFNPQGGKITVDGVNISDINLEKWRKNIGYVSQDLFLLNDTIANNIRFYDDGVSYDDIIKAVKLANIYEFIMQQPKAFNALVGERGLKLSAGQRQRIILARVIARKPEILILDEATSALDNESEVSIQRALESLRGKVTMLIVAHRLSTLMNSDKLMVLDGGKIIEEGSPQQLLKDKDSHFYRIYNIREG
ncbi:MAG: ABC transporter ATP-binding protein [Atribacterota bacterium]|nr:ABC transporter ATP-binding protein [Atribacterota bacterium]